MPDAGSAPKAAPAPDARDLPPLEADCSACAALCCVGLAMDRGAAFAIDKPAGVPCPNLSGHACTIHARLGARGFGGCVRFDCAGAGQRTVALFDGASWRDDPDLLAPMLDTFRHLRRVHELLGLLVAAGTLPLTAQEQALRRSLRDALCPDDMTVARAAALADGPVPGRVERFLQDIGGRLRPLRASADRPTSDLKTLDRS
jgi:hypothetical protein